MFSFIGVISLTTGKMVPLLVKRNRNDKEVDLNLAAWWLLPETIAIGSRSTQSEHKAVSN
jgi:hypothetical protein